MDFRRITHDDIPQVVDIQARIVRKEVSDLWGRMIARHVDTEDQVGFVAEDQGKVAGFIIGEIKIGGFGSEVTGWVEMMGVSPELMGSGIGKGLAQCMFDFYAEHGVSDVLTSVAWDSGDILAFFKGLGFDRSNFINLERKV